MLQPTIKSLHFGMDAEIQAMEGKHAAAQVFDLGTAQTSASPSMDAGYRYPCRYDDVLGTG
jgi:hypothetical protein